MNINIRSDTQVQFTKVCALGTEIVTWSHDQGCLKAEEQDGGLPKIPTLGVISRALTILVRFPSG